jgi:dihydroorotate dehydrogenase electron transfer subunit
MRQGVFTVEKNEAIADCTYRMRLSGDTGAIERPGQFINIAIAEFYLRRPISVMDWDESGVDIIYKVVGRGTEAMSQMKSGTELDVLTGLGNGYDIAPAKGKRILLAGGGCGVPPLIGLARRLKAAGESFSAAIGFETKSAVFGLDELQVESAFVGLSCADGSAGVRGFVTDVMQKMDYDYYFACGPEPMLKVVHAMGKEGQLSFEERMGCGFGICMGCSCKTLTGYKRICTEGPVMHSKEVRFDGRFIE